ncbi:MAG: alpha/beta hydrolase family protein, partial [Kiritimatiellae bacterium]|nr:alpha/beta hydrolase family protein [Kiritimatiellia bacterium]
MNARNLNPHRMFYEMAAAHRPKYRFDGGKPADFKRWHAEALPAVMACLGDYPESVPPRPELVVEWQDRGLRMQRWMLDVQPHLSAVLRVNIPGDLRPGEKRPAILCWHG